MFCNVLCQMFLHHRFWIEYPPFQTFLHTILHRP